MQTVIFFNEIFSVSAYVRLCVSVRMRVVCVFLCTCVCISPKLGLPLLTPQYSSRACRTRWSNRATTFSTPTSPVRLPVVRCACWAQGFGAWASSTAPTAGCPADSAGATSAMENRLSHPVAATCTQVSGYSVDSSCTICWQAMKIRACFFSSFSF